MNRHRIVFSGGYILLIVFLIGMQATVLFGEQCEGDSELLTNLGRRIKKRLAINDPNEMKILSHDDPDEPARYLRVLIKPEEIDEDGWRLIIRDSDYRPLQILGPKDFMAKTFKLTRLSLEGLGEENVPESILKDLEPLIDQQPRRKYAFLKAVKQRVGVEQMFQYQGLILKHAFETDIFLEKLWSRRLQNGKDQIIEQLFFDIDKTRSDIKASFKILEYIAMPQDVKEDVTYYSIKDPENFTEWPPLFKKDNLTNADKKKLKMRFWGDTVGFLMGSREEKSWCCSGVVIAVDESMAEPEVFFLTNFHCGGLRSLADDNYWTQEICDSTLVDLSWDEDGQSREYSCQEVIVKNFTLDIAVLLLKPIDPDSAPIPVVIRKPQISTDEYILPGEYLTIIHHPVCEPKRISTIIDDSRCQVIKTSIEGWQDDPDIDFTHQCDTQNGSSGAPVFDQKGRLVGLHHLGFEKIPSTNRCDRLNKAVRMDKILEVLEANGIQGLRIE